MIFLSLGRSKKSHGDSSPTAQTLKQTKAERLGQVPQPTEGVRCLAWVGFFPQFCLPASRNSYSRVLNLKGFFDPEYQAFSLQGFSTMKGRLPAPLSPLALSKPQQLHESSAGYRSGARSESPSLQI